MSQVDLFLHIGIFKTGTTVLQYYLSEHCVELRELGVLYHGWRDNGFSPNHAFLADPIIKGEVSEAKQF